ncbi:putative RNA-directed DNA polymerase [Tanacetum coccineum]
MSETEPIPPTSSVTALRIPIIKKGEYDLWSMKMRQYIAITDHILWDIITNGNQTTTDPASPSVSAPKTSLAANARRNNEKALNILLSAIPDRHLLSFHDAVDARSLWKAIKARFGGNEASKKMQKNLLKQQFETFTIGSREELDSAYERFQHILSMLELHDATVSIEDANLKFLRSLPSVWHVVATMIRGQPGLDELDFDDLYNNLKVYEHELKGVSNSNSQNIAFLSTEVKGSTLKQSTAEPAHIPKGYTQAISSKVPTAPNCASHSDEIICSFFAQQASMPTTHDDEDLLQIDEDAMEEIDIRWQVAMITARIRKFMRKTGREDRPGRPIDLTKPKNGSQQMVPYRKEDCAIEIQNLKSLEATDNNEDIDWTKEFDAEPTTFAMMALTESSAINRNKVIIEDWVDSDDEETDVSESQKETAFNSENSETSFENRSPNSQNSVGQESRTKGLGNKGGKLCFVCYSPNHLIKDCNLHERTFKQTQTHKPKGTQGSRETRPVWNNIQRVNHSNFSRNSRYPHQRRSFIPSAVLTRDGLISTARPTMTQTVPSKSTANVTYQGTARSRVPQAVLSRSTDGSYYPRMDNRRPRISSYSPSSRSSTTRTPHRPHRPKKIVKSIWVKKGSTVESQAVLPQTVKKSAMINPKQTWRPKGNYLDSVNRDNGSYTLKPNLVLDALKYEQEDKDNPHHAHASILKDSIRLDYVRSSSLISYLLHKYCAKEAHVLFTDKECLILSPRSKRLGQVNLKNNNKLVQGNLVRGLPSKTLKIDSFVSLHVTRGSNHRAPCKRTPQQNGVAERKNRTLIEAARTMLADSLLPIQFWAEAVNTACYVLNRVLVTNLKLNSYENFDGKILQHQFHETFGMLTDLFYTEYSRSIVHDSVTKFNFRNDVEDLDDQQFIVHTAPPMPPEERTAAKDVPLSSEEQALHDELMNLMHQESLAKANNDDQRIAFEEEKRRISIAKGKEHVNSTFTLSTANTPPQSAGNTPTDSDDDVPKDGIFSTNSFDAEESGVVDHNNMDPTINVPSTPTLRIHKIHPQSQIIGKSTAGVQTRRKLQDSTSNQHQALLSFIYKQNRTNHKDQQTCLFACFLSQEEPKKVSQALADESWVEAMQEELLQFKLQDVWVLCDLPEGKRVIGTKWVFRNKRDERGTIIKNKARLVAQGYRQEEGVDYDEVFAPVARIEAIRLFLAFASFMGFIVYQMDVKSAFLYGNITEEVYVKQPPGFEDPAHPNKVYRVVKALYGLHQAPRAWYERLSTFLLKHGYRRGAIDKTLFIKKDRRDIMLVQVYVDDIIFGSTKSSMVKDFEDLMQKEFKMSSMGELTFFLGLQVKQSNGGIFLSQDKYVKDILNKFDFRTIKPASTPIEAHKSLGKDEEGEDVDVHLYRSMIGCLMYLTASRPDIMFAVCLCARFQVTPKVSHLHAVKRIFRYLKHQPKLGLWYPKDSPFHLEAFSDSDYAGDNHDRRSTSGGCQYLGRRLVSWQCKKQTIVAISSTEAEYVAAASCCAQVLWMQNQLLDYGFNFMNTEIHIDNESTICIVKNPVFHSKTKHIQIRHHFIRDCYEQRLINVVKVHTDDNVADLLTKGFDLARFNFLVVTIGMMNP